MDFRAGELRRWEKSPRQRYRRSWLQARSLAQEVGARLSQGLLHLCENKGEGVEDLDLEAERKEQQQYLEGWNNLQAESKSWQFE